MASVSTGGASNAGSAAQQFELSNVRCRVHPTVMLTMLDGHGRWVPNGQQFAIGTLLGTVTNAGRSAAAKNVVIVDILDCFVNNYHWDALNDALSIPKDFHEGMLKLKEKLNQKLQVIGWCITTDIQEYITALSDWARNDIKSSHFAPVKQLPEAIILSIDPSFTKASNLLSATRALVRGPLEHLFHQIPLNFTINENDASAISAIIKASTALTGSPTGPTSRDVSMQASRPDLIRSLKELQFLVKSCHQYVLRVLRGELKGDTAIGRELLRTVCVDTLMLPEKCDELCEAAVHDALAIAYLINLAKIQFNNAEELAWSAQQSHQGQQS